MNFLNMKQMTSGQLEKGAEMVFFPMEVDSSILDLTLKGYQEELDEIKTTVSEIVDSNEGKNVRWKIAVIPTEEDTAESLYKLSADIFDSIVLGSLGEDRPYRMAHSVYHKLGASCNLSPHTLNEACKKFSRLNSISASAVTPEYVIDMVFNEEESEEE